MQDRHSTVVFFHVFCSCTCSSSSNKASTMRSSVEDLLLMPLFHTLKRSGCCWKIIIFIKKCCLFSNSLFSFFSFIFCLPCSVLFYHFFYTVLYQFLQRSSNVFFVIFFLAFFESLCLFTYASVSIPVEYLFWTYNNFFWILFDMLHTNLMLF